MKKRIISLILVAVLACVLWGCGHSHEWQEASCETPKTCVECQETQGEALGHNWETACESPETCALCGETRGEAPGHSWVEAACEAPKSCTVCGATEGEPLGHTIVKGKLLESSEEAYGNMILAGTCDVCGMETEEYIYDLRDLVYGGWTITSESGTEVTDGQAFAAFYEDGTFGIAVNGGLDVGTWEGYMSYTVDPADGEAKKGEATVNLVISTGVTVSGEIDTEDTSSMTLSMGSVVYQLKRGRTISEQEKISGEALAGKWELRAITYGSQGVDASENGLSGTLEFTAEGMTALALTSADDSVTSNGYSTYVSFSEVEGMQMYAYGMYMTGDRMIFTLVFSDTPLVEGLLEESPYIALQAGNGTLWCFVKVSE